MKKTLIALAILASVAGLAQAQSAVTIYGKVDLGITKLSGDLTTAAEATQMQGNHSSRLGFKGTEDLGGGLSAIFQFENRFTADTGAQVGAALFSGPAYVGLAGTFGAVRLGRNYSTIDSTSSAAIDPFEGDGIGFMSVVTRARINNSITYYTPEMSGFGAQAQFILRENGDVSTVRFDPVTGLAVPITTDEQNNGYAVGVTYNNGPIYVGAGFGREENSDKSNIWDISGSYAFGPAKIALGYDQLKIKFPLSDDVKVKNAVVAFTYELGAGLIKTAYSQTKAEDDKTQKFAIGYQHNLSKRTSLYADVARTKFSSPNIADTDFTGLGVGVTHNF